MQAFIPVVAVLAGILLGYLLRQAAAKKEQPEAEGRAAQAAAEVGAMRAELGRAQSLADARAGFESLAVEREKAARLLAAERDGLRTSLEEKFEAERLQSARISALEAELRNERQNMGEKLELLEAAKQTLAHQFQALAGEVLETKAKTFAESSRNDLGNLLTPLQTQIREFREKVEQAQSDSNTGVTRMETLVMMML